MPAPTWSVFGHLRSGPLSILKETWTGERTLPTKTLAADKYLAELHEKLEAASKYAEQNAKDEQLKYIRACNHSAGDKHFQVGEKCLILQKDDSSNSMFAKWKGPAEIVSVRSPYSYVVNLNSNEYLLHANKLRKFRVRADAASCSDVRRTGNSERLL